MVEPTYRPPPAKDRMSDEQVAAWYSRRLPEREQRKFGFVVDVIDERDGDHDRDAVVTKAMNAADRVLALLDVARDLAQTGKEWVGGLARGVYARVSRLVDAFRNMASRAAQAFRDEFNRIIPSRISIPRVSIDIPNVLGGGSVGIGGGSLRIPQLNTGGRIASDGLAVLHKGERVLPRAQVRDRGPQPTGGDTVTVDTVNIMVQGSGDGRVDGRNIAREFERELSDRGA